MKMTPQESRNIEVVRSYLAALERGEVGDDLRLYFAADALQIEFPNALNPRGQKSDLEQLLERSRMGLKILKRQEYQIVTAVAQGDLVAVEARWTGVLAVDVAKLPAGKELRASFAMFFELREGRIAKQHNYDCFDPW
jgi:ketosteroid isomerase-like protein